MLLDPTSLPAGRITIPASTALRVHASHIPSMISFLSLGALCTATLLVVDKLFILVEESLLELIVSLLVLIGILRALILVMAVWSNT